MSDILHGLLLAVNDQLPSAETPYVKSTYDRLAALGMSDEQIREEIADCLGEEIDEMLHQNRVFDHKKYRALLDALPWNEAPQSQNDLENL